MPHFSIQISPAGPLFDAYISVSEARAAALLLAKQQLPLARKIRALLDTGASHTCLDPSIINDLQIPPTGTTSVLTPSTGATPHTVNLYDVCINIPGSKPPPHILGTVAVAGCELLQSQGFHALIGRDILSQWTVYYNGPLKLITISY